MNEPTNHQHAGGRSSRSRSVGVVFWIFAAVGLTFLLIEHREHALQYLPYALLIACPLLHLFAHGGHGSHGRGPTRSGDRDKLHPDQPRSGGIE